MNYYFLEDQQNSEINIEMINNKDSRVFDQLFCE